MKADQDSFSETNILDICTCCWYEFGLLDFILLIERPTNQQNFQYTCMKTLGVSWPSSLVHWTQVLVLSECGFESRPVRSQCLHPWARHINHNCLVLRMGCKAVGTVCCVMHVKVPRTLIVKEKGLVAVFLDLCLEHPAGWICAHYKSSVLLLLCIAQFHRTNKHKFAEQINLLSSIICLAALWNLTLVLATYLKLSISTASTKCYNVYQVSQHQNSNKVDVLHVSV